MNSLSWVRFICSFFPPIVAQSVRDRLMPVAKGEKLAVEFRRRAFTGSYFLGNTSDFHAFKFLIHGYFDWRNVVLAKKINKMKTGDLVEVGANIGTETIGLADLDTDTTVHAFEPLPSNFESLRRIKEYNQLDNLKLYNTLVSNEKGEAYFKVPSKNSSGSGHILDQGNDEATRFQVLTLDETLSNTQSVAAIIADVEGYEPHVLAGATQVIQKHKPFLILEVNQRFLKERAQTTVADFHHHLEQMGYDCFYIERLGLRPVNAPNFEVKSNKNWLCIPEEYSEKNNRLSRAIRNNAFNPLLRYIVF
ncbi:MAG: FkbM family methyltransferase [Flavobacteriaceae bacterium]|nr:FkbM family methyltransferase [Flavobacteriaceae bacterium]